VMVSGAEPLTLREAPAVSVCHVAPFLVMVQEFTLAALHDTFVASPLCTRFDGTLSETVGTRTVTVTIFELTEPPGPIQTV